MATIQQIEANRRNAEHSTGPRSVEGKAVSCFNAIKTGIDAKSQIVRGEDLAELQTLTAEYQQRWQPATPEQRLLVDTLIDCEWLLRRFRKSEAQLWQCKMQELDVWKPKPKGLLGETFSRGSEEFSRLQRRIDSTSRYYPKRRPQPRRTPSARPRNGAAGVRCRVWWSRRFPLVGNLPSELQPERDLAAARARAERVAVRRDGQAHSRRRLHYARRRRVPDGVDRAVRTHGVVVLPPHSHHHLRFFGELKISPSGIHPSASR